MIKDIMNIPASIHDRLLHLSRSRNQLFNELLYIYANERFLYRLSISPYQSKFVLKGAMAILNLAFEHPRYTRDIDLLGFTDNSAQNIEEIIREICKIDVKEDGLVFDPNSVQGEPIKETDEYSGVRVKFDANLGNAKITNLQVDVGVGDIVYPQPKEEEYRCLLDLPKAIIQIYPTEAILAEKIHALEKYGYINSRMKDIYDIWYIASNQKIDGETLCESLLLTFKNRQTSFPESLVIFKEDYIDERRITAWGSLGKKLQPGVDLHELTYVIDQLRMYLIPMMESLHQGKEFSFEWDPSKDWSWQ
jgi:predicted nucleotidyltransferase component of viral defense system